MSENRKTLYLCYFGLHEPLVQTQVLPYLREIQKDGVKVSLLTFEPNPKQNWTNEQIETEKHKLADEGIEWDFLTYHKRPSAAATLYDVLNGVRFILKQSRTEKIDFLHARAHIPVFMALIASKFTKSSIIFDIRGLMAEEYADAGITSEHSDRFRFIKYIERKGIEKAAQIVVLTRRFRDYLVENNLKKGERIEVIPCCVDFSRIGELDEKEKGGRFELIYAGSVTGLYLLREMGEFFLELKKRQSDAFFRVLTASDPQFVRETFGDLMIDENDFEVAKCASGDVPKYLKRARLGISFRKPTFSQIASSPTKIPEYLACGLPVVSNYGIGDTDSLIEQNRIGVILENFENYTREKAADKIVNLLREADLEERCRKIALEKFDLKKTGRNGYLNVYRRAADSQ